MAEGEVNINKNLEGIDGWLLVYVILLGINLLHTSISLILVYINPLFVGINTTFFLISVFSWILGLSIFVLIFTKKRWVPNYIIFVIWLQFVIGLVYTLTNLIDFEYSLKSLLSSMGVIFNLVLNFVFSIVLTLYFLKSNRVKNTFVR